MSHPVAHDPALTREKLLDAAEELFVSRGVAATSLDQIARHAGLTRGAVYWHFANKAALFNAMHERVKLPLDALFEETLANPADACAALRHVCLHMLERMMTDQSMRRVFTILLFRADQLDDLPEVTDRLALKKAQACTRFVNVFRLAETQGRLRPDVSPDLAADTLLTLLHGFFLNYLRDPDSYRATHCAAQLDLFLSGICC